MSKELYQEVSELYKRVCDNWGEVLETDHLSFLFGEELLKLGFERSEILFVPMVAKEGSEIYVKVEDDSYIYYLGSSIITRRKV